MDSRKDAATDADHPRDPRRQGKKSKGGKKKHAQKAVYNLSNYNCVTSPLSKAEVNKATLNQSKCEDWHKYRYGRITASQIYPIQQAVRMWEKKKVSGAEKPDRYLHQRFIKIAHQMIKKASTSSPTTKDGRPICDLPAIHWGRTNESNAAEQYMKEIQEVDGSAAELDLSGFVLDKNESCMGVSPDGLVKRNDEETILLEIKCPVSRKGDGLDAVLTKTVVKRQKKRKTLSKDKDVDALLKKELDAKHVDAILKRDMNFPVQVEVPKPFYANRVPGEFVDGMRRYVLNNHRQAQEYVAQVKFSLKVLGLQTGHLFIWTPVNWGVVTIQRDLEWEAKFMPHFRRFINNYLVPEALNGGQFLALSDDVMESDPSPNTYNCCHCVEEARKKEEEGGEDEESSSSSSSSSSEAESDDEAPPVKIARE